MIKKPLTKKYESKTKKAGSPMLNNTQYEIDFESPAVNEHPLAIGPPSREKGQSWEEATIKFIRFHRNNPDVYHAFKMICKRMHAMDFKSFSIMGVVERYRWTWHEDKNKDIEENFLYCNNYNPYYARLLACDLDQLRDWFSFCHCKADNPIFYKFLKTATGVSNPVAIFKLGGEKDEKTEDSVR